jgi:hypothetical protein
VPVCGLTILAAAEAALAIAVRTGWSYVIAGPLLLAAGAGHGAGFGALVPQLTARTRAAHVPTLSGLITTITQLGIAAGIATLGGLYLAIAHTGRPVTSDHASFQEWWGVALILASASLAGAGLALHVTISSRTQRQAAPLTTAAER